MSEPLCLTREVKSDGGACGVRERRKMSGDWLLRSTFAGLFRLGLAAGSAVRQDRIAAGSAARGAIFLFLDGGLATGLKTTLAVQRIEYSRHPKSQVILCPRMVDPRGSNALVSGIGNLDSRMTPQATQSVVNRA